MLDGAPFIVLTTTVVDDRAYNLFYGIPRERYLPGGSQVLPNTYDLRTTTLPEAGEQLTGFSVNTSIILEEAGYGLGTFARGSISGEVTSLVPPPAP